MRSRFLGQLTAVFLLFCSVFAFAQDSRATVEPASAELKIYNRSVMVFHAVLFGETPEIRVKRAKAVINEAMNEADDLNVTLDSIQSSYMVLLGSRRAFIVSSQDVDASQFESVRQAAESAADKLRQVVSETQEARSLHFILRSLAAAALATGILIAALWGMAYLRRRLLSKLPDLMDRHTQALKVGRVQVIDANYLYPLVSRLLGLLRWLVVLLLIYEWLGFILSRFPYTRPWGEKP